MAKTIEQARAAIKVVINETIARIKEAQQERKDAYTSEDAHIATAIEREMISVKIRLESLRKSLKD